jgi:hypothetical protein
MTALTGYDAWKTGENEPDGIYCGECSRAVDASRDKQEHAVHCSQHPQAHAIRLRAVVKAARAIIDETYLPLGVRFDEVGPLAFAEDVKLVGDDAWITVHLFVPAKEIDEAA